MILLVRHALVDACGVFLAGRTRGLHLNEEGRRQAAALGDRLSGLQIAAIYTSPLERAQETAQALAAGRGEHAIVADDLDEIDFGEWTGLSFDDLNGRQDWIGFNRCRSAAAIPGGEWMIGVQTRACRALTRIHREHPHEHVAIVSHGDVLRALIAGLLGMPLDRIDQFSVDPASVSVLQPSGRGFELMQLNCHAYRDHCCAAHR